MQRLKCSAARSALTGYLTPSVRLNQRSSFAQARTVKDRLDVSNLKSGIYLLRLTQDGATSTKKLVIR